MNIYQDESGCLGFQSGSSKYFGIALLCPNNSKHVGNVIRKFKGKLIKVGWPKGYEIKAHNLFVAGTDRRVPQGYTYKATPEVPILDILRRITNCDIEIDAMVILKSKINSNLRTLPNGILLNYFSGQVLIDRVLQYSDVNLYVDETNKQTHDEQHFDGYIKTQALIKRGSNFPFNIVHGNSNVIAGISAVDFVSWAIFRKYEFQDDRFYNIISGKIKHFKPFFFK